MSQEPSIDPQPGQIADGMVEVHGATEIIGRRGVRPPDATTGAQPVDGPPIAADSPVTRGEATAPELPAAPAPLPAPAGSSGGVSARRKRARAGAAAVLLGAAASVLAAILRRRAGERQALEAPPAATVATPPAPAAIAETASGPPADVEVSLTAGVVADDDPTTLSSNDARHLDLPQRRRQAEAEQAEAEREAEVEPGASEGAANVSLTAGVVPPEARTPARDQRRE